ncbi:substrate-binding domain-containing protein [Phytohabitans sp. LJ34]|uniref:substrate-binding domain-containing protein n=1 Tax=Phytohabitans sp. LJ34 TaxID=3452217 RepID=UPI003F8A7499
MRPVLAVAALGAVALLVATGLYIRVRDEPGGATRLTSACPHTVRVVTASSFAPVLDALAPGTRADDSCVNLQVAVADGRAAPEAVERIDADVWIPDDSSWAAVAGGGLLAAKEVAGSGTVLAETPIYMVTDAATADRLRAAGGSWLALANLVASDSGVRLAVRDPAGSGDGMVGAGGVAEAVWLAKGMDASALALARAMRVTRTVTGRDPALPAGRGEVGLVPEYALLPRLGSAPPAVLPGSDYAVVLRYTWLPTRAAVKDLARVAALDRFRTLLAGEAGAAALDDARLRAPGADTPPGADVQLPALARARMGVLGPHHVDHVLATWYAPDRRTNLLAVVDVSGSMGQQAPGSGAKLIDLVREGCRALGRLLPDDSRVGIWEFGLALDPPRDYRVVLPTAPLAAGHRAAMDAAVSRLAARQTGTGLYDTILAAYIAGRDAAEPGVSTQVLIFTDGRNEGDAQGMTLAQLTAGLQRAKDPARPIHLSVVAFGQRREAKLLAGAVKPVDGYVADLATAEEVTAVFIHTAAGGLHGD